MINELLALWGSALSTMNQLGVSWLVLFLAIAVLPFVHVILSAWWERPAKIGWAVSLLFLHLLAYGVFLFVTLNRVNRREMDRVRAPAGAVPRGRLPIVFLIGRWIAILGRVAAIAVAIGIPAWALLHLGDRTWSGRDWWPLYYWFLFVYWIPVEIVAQLLMALGRALRRAQKSAA
jgi:hypothetical protein